MDALESEDNLVELPECGVNGWWKEKLDYSRRVRMECLVETEVR